MFSPGCRVRGSENGYEAAQRVVEYGARHEGQNFVLPTTASFQNLQEDVTTLQAADTASEPQRSTSDVQVVAAQAAQAVKNQHPATSLQMYGRNGDTTLARQVIRQTLAAHADLRNSPTHALQQIANQLRFRKPLTNVQETQLTEHRTSVIRQTLHNADYVQPLDLLAIAQNCNVLTDSDRTALIQKTVHLPSEHSRMKIIRTLGQHAKLLNANELDLIMRTIETCGEDNLAANALAGWKHAIRLLPPERVRSTWNRIQSNISDVGLRTMLRELAPATIHFPADLKQPLLSQVERLRRTDHQGDLNAYYGNRSLLDSREAGICAEIPSLKGAASASPVVQIGGSLAGRSKEEISESIREIVSTTSPTAVLGMLSRISAVLNRDEQNGLVMADHFDTLATKILSTTYRRSLALENQALEPFHDQIDALRTIDRLDIIRRQRETIRKTIQDMGHLNISEHDLREAQSAVETEDRHTSQIQNAGELHATLSEQLRNHVHAGERLMRTQTERILVGLHEHSTLLAQLSQQHMLQLAQRIGYESHALAELTTTQTRALMHHIDDRAYILVEQSRQGMLALAELQTTQNQALLEHVIAQADRAIQSNQIGFEELLNIGEERNRYMLQAVHAEVDRAICSGENGLNQLAALQGLTNAQIQERLSLVHRSIDEGLASPQFRKAIEQAQAKGKTPNSIWSKAREFGYKILERGMGQQVGRWLDSIFQVFFS